MWWIRDAFAPWKSPRKTRSAARRAGATRSRPGPRPVERLEQRELLTTFTVSNVMVTGIGSLRQAIQQANATPGPDTIDFAVAGTIRVGRNALPAITDTLSIDGTTAPGFAGTPVVTVDYQGTRGLTFGRGSDRSALRSLALIRSGGAGLTLAASGITVQGNLIGVLADGVTPAPNRGDGIRIEPGSRHNLIGDDDPVSSISYFDASGLSLQPVSGWQGIRDAASPGQFLLTGTSSTNGLLYIGPISGVGGTSYAVNVPNASSSSVYGPDLLPNGSLRLVGSYRDGTSTVHGFLYEGTTANLGDASRYRTIDYPSAQYTYVHSTMGGLAVGNADGPEGNLPLGTGHAFLYDVAANTLRPDIVDPGATTTTAYGIWFNGGTSYTICGGFSGLDGQGRALSHAYLVDYDSATGLYTNWTPFEYPNGLLGQDYITHFEGISSDAPGVYTLVADSLQRGTTNPAQGSFVTVRRTDQGGFSPGSWVDLNVPGGVGITSANSVAGQQVVGIVIGAAGTQSYQATVNFGFQLSNVISANGGNGIGVYGADDNRIASNYIGTDITGTLPRGNARNGIQITAGAARNLVGGQASGGNDPTGGIFVRPPLGNLISANARAGVLIDRGATGNVLSGNFIGTGASGNSALGNGADGVAIVGADRNALIGCTVNENPFVFYNVIGGNRGNGVRTHDANDTVVQANFLGAGADNATIVANRGDGLLVSGRSRSTLVGGIIPLGNVISGNDRHGIEVRDRASGFTSYNTFAGLFAFGGAAPNQGDGLRITSSGANNLVLITVASGNRGDGISIGGNASGVQVVAAIVGTTTDISAPLPNGGNGIRVWGHAHDIILGGPFPPFIPGGDPRVPAAPLAIGGNRGYGLVVEGHAHHIRVTDTNVGTTSADGGPIGNQAGGILLNPGTWGLTIGGPAPTDRVRIAINGGNGLTLHCSRRNTIDGSLIVDNQGIGLLATGICDGTVVRRTVIARNAGGDVNLTRSRGVTYIPFAEPIIAG